MIFNIIFKYNLKFDIKKLTFMNLVNKDIYVLLPDKGLMINIQLEIQKRMNM